MSFKIRMLFCLSLMLFSFLKGSDNTSPYPSIATAPTPHPSPTVPPPAAPPPKPNSYFDDPTSSSNHNRMSIQPADMHWHIPLTTQTIALPPNDAQTQETSALMQSMHAKLDTLIQATSMAILPTETERGMHHITEMLQHLQNRSKQLHEHTTLQYTALMTVLTRIERRSATHMQHMVTPLQSQQTKQTAMLRSMYQQLTTLNERMAKLEQASPMPTTFQLVPMADHTGVSQPTTIYAPPRRDSMRLRIPQRLPAPTRSQKTMLQYSSSSSSYMSDDTPDDTSSPASSSEDESTSKKYDDNNNNKMFNPKNWSHKKYLFKRALEKDNDPVKAEKIARNTLKQAQESSQPQYICQATYVVGKALQAQQRIDEARTHFKYVLKHAQGPGAGTLLRETRKRMAECKKTSQDQINSNTKVTRNVSSSRTSSTSGKTYITQEDIERLENNWNETCKQSVHKADIQSRLQIIETFLQKLNDFGSLRAHPLYQRVLTKKAEILANLPHKSDDDRKRARETIKMINEDRLKGITKRKFRQAQAKLNQEQEETQANKRSRND